MVGRVICFSSPFLAANSVEAIVRLAQARHLGASVLRCGASPAGFMDIDDISRYAARQAIVQNDAGKAGFSAMLADAKGQP